MKSQTKIEITSLSLKAISDCALEFSFDEASTISKDIAFSISKMFSKLLKDEGFTEFFLGSDLLFAIGHIFELTFIKTHEDSDKDIIKNIQESSQVCWDLISRASNTHSRREAIINNLIRQVKDSLLDVRCTARYPNLINSINLM